MLTKKIRFDDDILAIIRNIEWSYDGTLGKLICGQLSRPTYERVNLALETLGGKWNRSLGGHAFKTDPRGQVEGLLENGSLTIEKDGFFETSEPVVKRMLELVSLSESGELILEPSAGLGAIARHLHGNLTLIEKNPQRCEELRKTFSNVTCMDFLYFHPEIKFDRIYMNPPFEDGQDIDHVIHAHQCLAKGGMMISVMCEGPFFRSDKKSMQFRGWLSTWKGYVESLPVKSFHTNGTDINMKLVRIAK